MKPIIRVKNLSKQYFIGRRQAAYATVRDSLVNMARLPLNLLRRRGRSAEQSIWALKDVSFEVNPGEVVGVVGRNGAGKSTMLKVLSRITEPTGGRIELFGRVGSLLEVGTGFHPELTGRENIYLNGAILGMRRVEINRKFDEIVAFAEIEEFLDTPVKRYSSGMYTRLAFAVAAHLEPEIMVVDEVLSVGDAAFQEKCLGKMGEVAHAGRTVLFVSHNMAAVTSLCDRAIWIDQGQIKADGESAEIVQRYLQTAFASSLAQGGVTSLANRMDRKGDGTLKLTHVRLLDDKNTQISHLRCGQTVKIALGYRASNQTNLSETTVGFTILNRSQQFIGYCQSDISGDRLVNLPTAGEFVCEFSKLPLMPGRYTLNVACRVRSSVADGVYHAAEFEVLEGEFYTTKLLPSSGYGDSLLEYRWSVSESVGHDPGQEAQANGEMRRIAL
ncbi:MAG: ABC transporter ATP-binding protein [Acidobacteria bacterium]|nr:ABC transporter ATP-binding protein [Acidobacteriota bacterium]